MTKQERIAKLEVASEISLPWTIRDKEAAAFFQKHSADLDLIYGEEPQ